MATLNELGRNSASITYGPYSNGQDLFPTLQAVDAWMRNDTWQGYATASGTTLTGVGTIWTTQARPGDYIMVAGQQRIIAASGVTSDTSITVTVAFSPAITVPSAVVAINSVQPSITGTLQNVVRGSTNGVVSCTNGSTTVTGVGTYFLSDVTNLVTTVALTGSIAIDTSGNITGTSTIFTTGAPSNNSLYPGDSIAVTVVTAGVMTGQTYYFTVASVTNDTTATVTVAPTLAIPSTSTVVKAINASGGGGTGRYININGRIRQVTAINSNTSLTVNVAMDFTDSNMKLKVYPRGSLANSSNYGGTLNGGTFVSAGTTALAISSVQGVILPGAVIWGPSGTFAAGTTIASQVSSTTVVIASTSSGSSGTNLLTVASGASIVVGQLVSGATAAIAGIPTGTYVTGISGTNVYLSQNLTGAVSAVSVSFSTPGGAGNYLTSAATTFSTVASCLASGITGSNSNFFWDLGYTFSNSTTNTVYMIQTSASDNIWITDEVRTLGFTSVIGGPLAALNGFTTDYAGYSGTAIGVIRQTLFNAPFKREDTYINGNGTSFLSDLRIGDDLIIDGTHVTVSNIISNTQFKITFDMTHSTPSSTVYKKLKLHGYVLEGTREGGPTATPGKWSQLTTMVVASAAAQSLPVGTTSIPLVAASTVTGVNQLVKISGAGGPPLVMTGQINFVSASTTVTGTGTQFTTQLHVGAEIVIAGQYVYVTAIASDTSMTVSATMTVASSGNVTPYYRTVPLYTYVTVNGATITLATPTKNTLYSIGVNPPTVAFPATGGDFIEYVYSAPNYYAESSTTTVLNQSYDRKYVGFRYWPFFASTNATPDNPTATPIANIIASSGNKSSVFGAYALPVYERWAGGYAGTHGVGVNLADLSGGTMVMGAQNTTAFTITQPIAGSLNTGMAIQGPGTTITAQAAGTFGAAGNTVTVTSGTVNASSIVAASLDGVYDVTAMTHVTGGYIYMFATKRYAVFQGKTFSNIQSQWVGCIEFERAQPEDSGTGSGASGVVFGGSIIETTGAAQLALGNVAGTLYGFSQSIRYLPGIAPWPCFAYVNGNRFPTGSAQIPTLPVLQTYPIHGGVLSTPRVRNSAGDLVGFNAHVYSACTITTGRWGHVVEFMATGVYASPGTPASNGIIAQSANQYSFSTGAAAGPINSIPQIHMGQIIPVFTNVYNSKRFMFSPVVVLGPAYDPDIRGRMYGLKVIPSNLGALMDTVSITVNTTTPSAFNPDFFYNTSGAATDHWVLTTPPGAGSVPGQTVVTSYRFTTTQNSAQIQQSWRSLEDNSQQLSNAAPSVFTNNFRFAIPA